MAEAIVKNDNNNLRTQIDKLIGFKKEAYSCLDQALGLDGKNQLNEAIVLYRKCISMLNKAIKYIIDNNLSKQSPEAQKIEQDLNVLIKKSKDRLVELLENDLNKAQKESKIVNNYDLCDDILEDDDNLDYLIENNVDNSESNAIEIFNIDNGVQLFYIAVDGSVSTPSYPTTMSIYMFNDQTNSSTTKGFIRVGNWTYPLSPQQTTVMHTSYGAFIFPDQSENKENADIKYSFIGVMINENVSKDNKQMFEDILANFSVILQQEQQQQHQQNGQSKQQPAQTRTEQRSEIRQQEQEKRPTVKPVEGKEKKTKEKESDEEKDKEKESDETTSERISKNIIAGAKYLSDGISKTTHLANKYINTGGEKIKTQVQQNEQPTKIDPKLQKGMENVRYGTHVAVRVSSFLVNKLGDLANYTARTAAPYIKSGSTKLLTSTGIVKSSDTAGGYVQDAANVAAGGLTGFSILYESLEGAAKSLAKGLTQQSVNVVQHKYGNDASKITENTLYSVGNVALSANNVRNLKITKTIAKATAKETIRSFSNHNLVQESSTKDQQSKPNEKK